MSAGETPTIDPLPSGVALDPAALIPRVVQQLLQQLLGGNGTTATLPVEGTQTAEDQLAEAISGWLTQLLGGGAEEPLLPSLDWDDLLDRNSAFAAAVGACDCWGEDPDCAFCEGDGVPGWTTPDERFFDTYVRPALGVMETSTTTTTNGDDEHDTD